MVKVIKNMAEYKALIASDKLVVVDFFATWCGPCKMIAPVLEEMSKTMTNVIFCKVDVDECEDIAAEEGIEAMPTFYFYKNGKKVDSLKGANKDGLKALIEKHK